MRTTALERVAAKANGRGGWLKLILLAKSAAVVFTKLVYLCIFKGFIFCTFPDMITAK